MKALPEGTADIRKQQPAKAGTSGADSQYLGVRILFGR
jgi:hypothetical protein